jgi:serine/threonine-protein kinase
VTLAGTQIGKYLVHRKLAEGGMAEIFLASALGPEGFEKRVVIKRIRSGFATDPLFIEMFISEARLASKLNHANIVQIFDFDRHEDSFYIAMEYVRGQSLADATQRATELSVPVHPLLAAQIAAEIARGLSFAHRLTEAGQPLNIVHRDVTPHNVLLSYEGSVKLTDFGIAKSGARASTIGTLKGKFAYMSPEQSRGEAVDNRTDIFALGITLWELLTGARLFNADSDVGVLRAVQEREIVPPHQLNPLVDENLGAIVDRALQRDREARFQSSAELERALTRYVVSTCENPELTDVGLWMRELFPMEAGRTEATVVPPISNPGRVAGSTVRSGPAMVADPGGPVQLDSTSEPFPLAGIKYDPTIALNPAGPRSRPRAASHVTPIVPANGQTQSRSPPVRRIRWIPPAALAVLLVGSAAVLAPRILRSGGPAPAPGTGAATDVEKKPPIEKDARLELKPQALSTPASPGIPAPPETETPRAPDLGSTPPPETPDRRAPPPPTKRGKRVSQAPAAISSPTHQSPSRPEPAPAIGPNPASALAPGKLVLTVSPWGDVTIDGKRLGEQVGRKEIELPAGDHVLEVQGPSNWGPKRITIRSGEKVSQAVLFN